MRVGVGSLGLVPMIWVCAGCSMFPGYRRVAQQHEAEKKTELCSNAQADRDRVVKAAYERIPEHVTFEDPSNFFGPGKPRLHELVGIHIETPGWSCETAPQPRAEDIPLVVTFEEPYHAPFILRRPGPTKTTAKQLEDKTGKAFVIQVIGRRMVEAQYRQRMLKDGPLVVTLQRSDCSNLFYTLANSGKDYVKVRAFSVHVGDRIESAAFEPPLMLPPTSAKDLRIPIPRGQQENVCPSLLADTQDRVVRLGVSAEYVASDTTRTLRGEESFAVKDLF